MKIVNKEKSKKFSRRLIIAAILALAGLVFTGCALDKKDSDVATMEVPATPAPKETKTPEIELSYETIAEDAAKFLESVDNAIGTKHNYTQEEIEMWIINLFALNTEIITPTEVSEQMNRILELMQAENQLRINKFLKGDYSTTTNAIDWSLIIPDKFEQSNELVGQIYNERVGLAESKSKDEALVHSQETINIIGDSWYAGGYDNAIPVGKLETFGAQAFTMSYMMMSQLIADAVPENGHIYSGPDYVCYNGEIPSSEMMQKLNAVPENCETGLNEFSQALWGIASENNMNTEFNKLKYLNR